MNHSESSIRLPKRRRPRLRVGVDGRLYSSPAAGIRRYSWELTQAVLECDRELEVVALGVSKEARLPPGVIAGGRAPSLPTNAGWYATGLPWLIATASLDVYHGLAYTAPLWSRSPVVLTLHDVSYARRPEWYPYHRDPLRRAFYRRSAFAANSLITDSEYSRQEIVRAYGFNPSRIYVVPLGASSTFHAGSGSTVLKPETLYALHVGDLHARRNLHTAFSAILRLRASEPSLSRLTLVLVGHDHGCGQALVDEAARRGEREAVVLLGTIPDEELRALYQRAAVFVYPSRYEGFGLPLLEAMQCGLPVVAARTSAIPEVTGSAGLLVEPDDVDGFARAIQRIVTDRRFADQRRFASLQRASNFSWTATAARTIQVYEECLRRSM